MHYPTYIVHFNKNHDSKNGQFTYGDGDGDGRINDHENQIKTSLKRKGYSDNDVSTAMKGFKETASKVGSNKTQDAYYKYVESIYEDKSNDNKVKKAIMNYSKTASKDIKETEKSGNIKNIWSRSNNMDYPTYLAHFNRNHDSRNGQFTYGDGDADGITDDHHHKSNTIKKYSGENADKNLNKHGRYKVYKKLSKEIEKERFKQYGLSSYNVNRHKGIGKNSEMAEKKSKKYSEEADRLAKNEWDKNRKKYDRLGYMDVEELAMEIYDDKFRHEDMMNKDIAYLLDLGYDKQGAKKVAEFLNSPYSTYSIG